MAWTEDGTWRANKECGVRIRLETDASPAGPTHAIGRHWLIDFHDCTGELDDPPIIEQAVREAVAVLGATLLKLHVQSYVPQGVTGVAVLAESHLAVHTWPERGYVGADVFTCGRMTGVEAAVDVLASHFRPQRKSVVSVDRGGNGS